MTVRIAAKIGTTCEKTFAKPYPTSVRDTVVRTRRSIPEMNASGSAGKRQ
jgi:hypothetical protein